MAINYTYSQKLDSCEYIVTFISSAPRFKGDMKEFIQKELRYPDDAKSDSIKGNVILSFWIDTLGFTSDHQILKGIRYDFDMEALRVARLIEFEKPAMQNNKPIRVKYIISVKFEPETDENKLSN